MPDIFRYSKNPRVLGIIDPLLALRALFFVGRRYTCPCCGWKLRAFTHGGFSVRVRHHGYCPRCNSKARHRRIWLFLKEQTNLFSGRLRLLHVSPKYALSRRLIKIPTVSYTGVDLETRPNSCVQMNLTDTPLRTNTFDAIICIHVLEHIEKDQEAMSELFRVLKPGGWAVLSVPIQLKEKTFEDPSITAPHERKRAFGEEEHVRIYGYDLVDRLETCGFSVELDLASRIQESTIMKYGLLADEQVLYCTKAGLSNVGEIENNAT